MKEKLTEAKGLRLTPTMNSRLGRAARTKGEDEMEIIRRAIGTELDRIEAAQPFGKAHEVLGELLLTVPESQVLAKLGEIAQEAASVAVAEDASCH